MIEALNFTRLQEEVRDRYEYNEQCIVESFLPDMTYSMYRELLRKIICIGIIIQKDI